ncbi:hypothetical protein C8R43DRAFT_944468 [Mycena crocata]|nr:hypothetical protein C8R43DRAFT_944468 [Mycena crocata]
MPFTKPLWVIRDTKPGSGLKATSRLAVRLVTHQCTLRPAKKRLGSKHDQTQFLCSIFFSLMGRPHRRQGKRSKAAIARRTAAYMAPGGPHKMGETKRTSMTELHPVEKFPGKFLSVPHNAKKICATIKKQYPGNPTMLPDISENHVNILLVPTPEMTSKQAGKVIAGQWPSYLESCVQKAGLTLLTTTLETLGALPYLLVRCSNVISEFVQALFWNAWLAFMAAKPKFPSKEHGRSATPAFHFGIWGLYKQLPIITCNARASRKTSAKQLILIPLIDRLLLLQLEIMGPVYARVKSALKEELRACPALDLGGLFYSCAMKEGSSEFIHIDFNDPLPLLTLIFVISRPGQVWTGGEFCVPQLNIKTPFQGGQMLAVRTCLLAHCSATVTGEGCLVLTCFSDSTLLEHALFGGADGNGPAVVVI